MSDQINSFDEVFHSKLSEHAVSPPDSVWENIATKRSFGHVVANKISINWRTFGTMLLLLLGGGSSAILFGGEEHANYKAPEETVNPITTIENKTENSFETANPQNKQESIKTKTIHDFYPKNLNEQLENIPDIELFASIEQAAFSRPVIKTDPLLNILINELDGWESAKPISFVRMYELDKMPQLSIKYSELENKPKASELEYDYVAYETSKKPFRERTSFLFAFTPQSITKTMTADYNLSSNYLKHRNNSEKTRLAYTFQANVYYELKNHKFFETGINLTQIYEQMSFKGEKRFSNQYDFVEIPLLLGYEDRNSKWGYQIKGGFGIQVFNNYKGYIYKRYVDPSNSTAVNPEHQYRMRNADAVKTIVTNDHKLAQAQDPNEVLDLRNKNENPYKTSGVVNIHLAAGITYYHSINTVFVISPYYKKSVNSITKENAQFTERISYMGVSLGTRIKF
ncbi:MAG: hypothetical protein KDB74_05955 [Flavobacteriales bacterium]|nr:hypothetical protein [Flavobacteriales bacterium]